MLIPPVHGCTDPASPPCLLTQATSFCTLLLNTSQLHVPSLSCSLLTSRRACQAATHCPLQLQTAHPPHCSRTGNTQLVASTMVTPRARSSNAASAYVSQVGDSPCADNSTRVGPGLLLHHCNAVSTHSHASLVCSVLSPAARCVRHGRTLISSLSQRCTRCDAAG